MARNTGFKIKNIPIEIIGEGLTEYYYMYKLKRLVHHLKPYNIKKSNFNHKTGYVTLEETIDNVIKKYEKKEVKIIVLFDLDVIKNDKKARENLERIKSNYEKNKNIIFCGSMPDIEYWFLLHFKHITKEMSSNECLSLLRQYITDYEKTEKYLKQDRWINILMQNDNLKKAVDRAKQNLTHNNCSYTDIYKAIEI